MNDKASVLIVSEDGTAVKRIVDALQHAGHWIVEATGVSAALDQLASKDYALILLDIDHADIGVARDMKAQRPMAEIIVITEHGTIDSVCAAIRHGADDYVVLSMPLRPLADAMVAALQRRRQRERQAQAITELADHVRALLDMERVHPAPEPSPFRITVGSLTIDTARRIAWIDQRIVPLSQAELNVLAALAQTPNVALSCEMIAHRAFRRPTTPKRASDRIRRHIASLRKKFAAMDAHDVAILTIRSAGYMLEVPSSLHAHDAQRDERRQPGKAAVRALCHG